MTDEWPPRKARSLQDWDAYWARQRWDRRFMRRTVRPQLARLRRRLPHPQRWQRQLRWAWHRSRYGWARCDWYSMDGYLARLLGQMIADFRDHNHSWPGEQNGVKTPEDWNALLTRMSDPLLNYDKHWDWPDGQTIDQHWENEKKVIADAQDAMRLIAEWFPYLWD